MITLRVVARDVSCMTDDFQLQMHYLSTLSTVFIILISLMLTLLSSVEGNLTDLQDDVLNEAFSSSGHDQVQSERRRRNNNQDELNESMMTVTSFQVKQSQQTSPAPSSDILDKSTLDNFTFPFFMLCTGLISLVIASIILMMTAKKKRSYIRLREFPATIANPIYDRALSQLRVNDDNEIEVAVEAIHLQSTSWPVSTPPLQTSHVESSVTN